MEYQQKSVTITSGTAVSNIVDISGRRIIGVLTPAAWDAADIYFEIDADGASTPVRAEDSAAAPVRVTGIAAAAGELHFVSQAQAPFLMGTRVRIRSRNNGDTADVNQTADRKVTLLLLA